MSEIRIVNFHSHVLKKPMAFYIYLPDTKYFPEELPVLYFFHGRNGDEHFLEQLDVKNITDRLIKKKSNKSNDHSLSKNGQYQRP